MGNESTARKIGVAAGVATKEAGRTRFGGALLSGARSASASMARVFHVLWLEVTGFIFLILALLAGTAGVREYHKAAGGSAETNKLWVAAIFAVLFAYFGITSFWRARKRGGTG